MATAGDDLYGGLVLPKKTKRERESEKEQQQQQEAVALSSADAAPTAKRQRLAGKKPRDLAAAVAKLKRYMLTHKTFAKPTALFCTLVDNALTAENSALFMDALTEVVDAKGIEWSGKKEFQTLIETLDNKRDMLVAEDFTYRKKLEVWRFQAITHAQLFTDETYQFGKASKVVKQRLEMLAGGNPTDDKAKELVAQRLHTELMPPLRTLFAKLSVRWAVTMVEDVLALATHHRLLFSEQDRREVDAWTKAVRERRSAPEVVRTAGSEARRNLVDASGSQAVPKVGRQNHPLFNREL